MRYFIVIPSLEGWPTKAKDAPSSHEVRLTLLDTNPVFHCLGDNKTMLQPWIVCKIVLQYLLEIPNLKTKSLQIPHHFLSTMKINTWKFHLFLNKLLEIPLAIYSTFLKNLCPQLTSQNCLFFQNKHIVPFSPLC